MVLDIKNNVSRKIKINGSYIFSITEIKNNIKLLL